MRRATKGSFRALAVLPFFYPRSPCGERPGSVNIDPPSIIFSIHALLAESDLIISMVPLLLRIFLSTLSLRRATMFAGILPHDGRIFYPRSPCGERPSTTIITICIVPFLSTLSLRRATLSPKAKNESNRIFYPRSPCGERQPFWQTYRCATCFSIHALLAESDACSAGLPDSPGLFYPRSPCGERLCHAVALQLTIQVFYPRSPCGERLLFLPLR